MTDTERKMMESLGLTEDDFKPNPVSDSDRLSDLEEAISLLAEVMTYGD